MSGRIEEGCLALIVNSEAGNEGKCVIVGKCLGVLYGYAPPTPRWEVDTRLRVKQGGYVSNAGEHQLLRIDGFSESQGIVYKESELVE